MAAGDGEIGGDGQLLARAGAQKGAIVADAESKAVMGLSGGAGADSGENRTFSALFAA